jgi:hypothetical protein
MSAEEQRAEQAEFLAAITVSFNGFGYPPAGEATGKDLFRALYMDRSVGFITDQVQRSSATGEILPGARRRAEASCPAPGVAQHRAGAGQQEPCRQEREATHAP